MRRVVATIVLALCVGCSRAGTDGIHELEATEKKFADAVKIAEVTPRAALPAHVQHLQSIKQELGRVGTNGCLNDAKQNLERHMDLTINAFLSFIRSNDSRERDTYLERAGAELENYRSNVQKCSRGPRP
jgi:hypothetical protein